MGLVSYPEKWPCFVINYFKLIQLITTNSEKIIFPEHAVIGGARGSVVG
jgi:hypothetical protein